MGRFIGFLINVAVLVASIFLFINKINYISSNPYYLNYVDDTSVKLINKEICSEYDSYNEKEEYIELSIEVKNNKHKLTDLGLCMKINGEGLDDCIITCEFYEINVTADNPSILKMQMKEPDTYLPNESMVKIYNALYNCNIDLLSIDYTYSKLTYEGVLYFSKYTYSSNSYNNEINIYSNAFDYYESEYRNKDRWYHN